MSPDDKEWLEKDIEDCVRLSQGRSEIPFYENEEWVRQFGEKPYVSSFVKLYFCGYKVVILLGF